MALLDIFPVLETERLNLIEIQQEHLHDLFTLFSDEKVTRFYNIKTFQSPQDGQIYLDWFRSRFTEKLGIRWGIQIKGREGIIGTIGYNNFTPHHRANIGYDIQSTHWGNRYMTEVLAAVIDFGFNSLQINRIEAEVMNGNTASGKLLEKARFSKEGTLRDWMYWNGTHYDMIMYSILKKDYI